MFYYHLYYDWKYPVTEKITYPPTILYEIQDTIITGPAPIYGENWDDYIIPLENLPIRNLSYRQILKEFGSDAVEYKGYGRVAEDVPDSFDRFPRRTAEKCHSLGRKPIYYIHLSYKDGSKDTLILIVYLEDDEIKVLWGYRINLIATLPD